MKKQQKNHLLQDSPAFYLNLRIPASLKKKHSRNQLEFFLLWKRNIPYNMPKSDYITGVTSALLYFKVTGKSDADHFGDFVPFLWNTWAFSSWVFRPRTPEGNSTSLRNTQSVSSFFESFQYKLGATL